MRNSTKIPNYVRVTLNAGLTDAILTARGFLSLLIGELSLKFSFVVMFIVVYIPVGVIFALVEIVQYIRHRKDNYDQKQRLSPSLLLSLILFQRQSEL